MNDLSKSAPVKTGCTLLRTPAIKYHQFPRLIPFQNTCFSVLRLNIKRTYFTPGINILLLGLRKRYVDASIMQGIVAGKYLPADVYFAQVRQGDQLQTLKLV
jgi:hypothetical protein